MELLDVETKKQELNNICALVLAGTPTKKEELV